MKKSAVHLCGQPVKLRSRWAVLALSSSLALSGCAELLIEDSGDNPPDFPQHLSSSVSQDNSQEDRISPEQLALTVTEYLQQSRLIYSSNPGKMTDCSGIMHRVFERLSASCPELPTPAKNKHRSSRDIAKWYEQRGQLSFITQPEAQSDLIQPGAIMFYGRKRGGSVADEKVIPNIGHIGIVAGVERDEEGKVTSYKLFHGISSGKPARTSTYKIPSASPKLPNFGSGRHHWLAVARLCSDNQCACVEPAAPGLLTASLDTTETAESEKPAAVSVAKPSAAKEKESPRRAAGKEARKFSQEGLASWYGPKLHGKKTASGERFSKDALTAAHRSLPFGSTVRVTEVKSGKSVVVRINDRLPKKSKRTIDLSEKAARQLGIKEKGLAKVKIEQIERLADSR